jgi:hypothetical protein
MGDRGRQGRRRLESRPDGTGRRRELTSRKLPPVTTDTVRRRLDVIRKVAIVDAVLLVPLVVAAIAQAEGLVNWLGPLHGFGYLVLLFLCIRGAGERLWGWWFPALVVVTLGPPGSLIGDLRIRRRLT